MSNEAEAILYGEERPRAEKLSDLERLKRWGLHAFSEPQLGHAMDRLQPEYQMILQLCGQGLTDREIGEELGFQGRELRRIGNLRLQAQDRLVAEMQALEAEV